MGPWNDRPLFLGFSFYFICPRLVAEESSNSETLIGTNKKTEDTNPYKGLFYVIKGPGKDTPNKTVNFNIITTLLQPNSSQKYSGSIPIYASKGLVGYLDFHFHQAEMKVQRNPHLVRLEKFK